ncbi:MAG TPA: hypothetical protein VFX96_04450 [Pyrinomonadaceae bacterium]|nr:hypothetical protein [Pyrinomonadaceae bacterium]
MRIRRVRTSHGPSASLFILTLALVAFANGAAALPHARTQAQTQQQQTPTEVVREHYRAMRERRYRDAFALTVYGPAFEKLKEDELAELQPDFERVASAIPADIVTTGEQISGDEATVFLKLGTDAEPKIEPVSLLRERGGPWVLGNRNDAEAVKKSGKKFFFETRIEVHHAEVEAMLRRIQTVEAIYASQNSGRFGDLQQLVSAGLVPADILATDSTGYRFRVQTVDGGKSYAAWAEPARYGRTGRLSFYADATGLRKDDKGGKPLKK